MPARSSRMRSSRCAAALSPLPLAGEDDAQSASGGGKSARLPGKPAPPHPRPQAGRETQRGERRADAAGAGRRAARHRAQRKNSTARNTKPCAALDRLKAWIERARDHGLCRHRHRDHESRSDAGGAVRLLAGRRAERGLLRAAVAPPGRRRRAAACSRARSRPIRSRSAPRSTRSSRCSKTPACSRSART